MGSHDDSHAARHAALDIVRTLRDRGHVAYFAGGCVRDEILDLEPTDYDVATDARPKVVSDMFDRTAEVGASFGVVLVQVGRVTIEVATFRADGVYSDKRRPDDITFADPESDARRRDFTINALFLDPLAAEDSPSIHGHIIDFVGGMADLQARVIRAVGDADARLEEDHLRALRAVRLASRLGFKIDRPTEDAIRRHARRLSGVSRERIGDEVRRMLSHPERAAAVSRLEALGLDEPIFSTPRGSGQTFRRLRALDASAPVSTCLAAWAIDRGLGQSLDDLVGAWRDALCLSNIERDDIHATLSILSQIDAWPGMTVARRKRIASASCFDEAVWPACGSRPGRRRPARARCHRARRHAPGPRSTPASGRGRSHRRGLDPGPRVPARARRRLRCSVGGTHRRSTGRHGTCPLVARLEGVEAGQGIVGGRVGSTTWRTGSFGV